VTEGVREIMSRPCPTCDGEGVIRSEETYAIEFERRLRDIAAENPDVEAFLVQINPRVTAEFTGHGSRVLHALEAETGKSFLFEGSEGLTLEHFAITFQGTRAEVEERALPFRQGDEVLVEIVEPHMYDVDDAVAKIDGYIISIAGAAPCVGEKRMVRIDQVGRTAASALLLDESGEVVRPTPRSTGPRNAGAGRESRRSGSGSSRDGEKVPARPERSKSRSRGRRASADSVDAQARREAGLSETPTAIDAEPEEEQARDAQQGAEPALSIAEEAPPKAADGPAQDAADEPGQADGGEEQAEGGEDVQSKPRRRGRRGGRRRSAAKAQSSTD
jgi:ribonuclease G